MQVALRHVPPSHDLFLQARFLLTVSIDVAASQTLVLMH